MVFKNIKIDNPLKWISEKIKEISEYRVLGFFKILRSQEKGRGQSTRKVREKLLS